MSANWFVALPVPAGSWFDAHVGEPPPGVRRFHPDDLHATLAFLGQVDEAAAREALEAAVDGWPVPGPIQARLGPVVPMGSPRRYSALSALLEDEAGALVRGFAAVRDEALAVAGAPPDARPPKPHVTVARPGRRADAATRRAGLAWAERLGIHGAEVTLDAIALYTWAHDRRERLFRVVDRRPLGDPQR